MLQPHNPIAHLADLFEAMGYKQHRRSAAHQLQHPLAALFLKVRVTHGQNLVHDQNFGIHHRGDREGQPGQHTGGIVADGHLNKLPQLGEGHDLVVLGLQKFLAVPQDRAVEENILVPRQVHVKAGAQLQHGDDVAVAGHAALGGL